MDTNLFRSRSIEAQSIEDLVLASGDPESNPSSTEFFLLCALVVWVESDLTRKNEELLEEGGNLKYDLKKRNIALKVLH